MKKILLLGKNGQLGWELQRALAPLGELVAFDLPDVDFSQPESLARMVRECQPDIIVNAAAHTAVDKAESEAALAHAINTEAPGVLAREAAALGAWLMHYSTDYVFDGSGTHARDEEAPTGPLSVYGRTKLGGEERVRASGCRHLIVRTSWVYAARGGNFAKTMLKLAAERDRLTVIADQIGAPTGADTLADISAHMLHTVQSRPELTGTYHAVASGETSWHGYAQFIIQEAQAMGAPFKASLEAIKPVPTCDYPTAAQRPLNSRLATAKLSREFGLSLPPWQWGVRRMLTEVLGR